MSYLKAALIYFNRGEFRKILTTIILFSQTLNSSLLHLE